MTKQVTMGRNTQSRPKAKHPLYQICLALVLLVPFATWGQWTHYSVDNGATVGSLVMLDNGSVQVVYVRYLGDYSYLRLATGIDSTWQVETVETVHTDGHGVYIYNVASAAAPNGNRFVLQSTDDNYGDELHLWEWDGLTWTMTNFNGVSTNSFYTGQHIGLVLNALGEPVVSYDSGGQIVRERVGGLWSSESIAGVESTNRGIAMCIDTQDGLHFMVANGSAHDHDDMSYSHWDGEAWHTRRFEDGMNVHPSLAVDEDGAVHAAWGTGSEGQNLVYYIRDPGTGLWSSESVSVRSSSVGSVSATAIALDSQRRPHILFSRFVGPLMYAYRDYNGWHVEEVISGSYDSLSMAIDSNDTIHIVYPGVKYATRELPDMQDGPEYTIEYVVAHWVSGAVDPNDACEINLDQILQAITWWASAAEVPETGGGVIDLDKILDLIDKWAAATCIDDPYNPMRVSHPQSSTVPMGDGAAVSVSRAITPSIADPGDTIRVEVAVEANQDIFGLGLDEALVGLPADWSPWTVAVVDNDGASYNAAEKQWLWLSLNEGDTKTLIYDITIPVDADTGLYEITGTAQSASPKLNAAIAGDRTILVGEPGDATGDGVVDICDIRLCYQIATGVIAGTAFERAMCDVDGDGDVDLEDVNLLY